MIYCVQFPSLLKKIQGFEADPMAHGAEIDRLCELAGKYAKHRYYYKKGRFVLMRAILGFRAVVRPAGQDRLK